jgi:hypothetical protein
MLAHVRSCFLCCFLLTLFAFGALPAHAQINGVPASVTSYGFGGRSTPTPGVRASVTSLGPNGYGNARGGFGNCCASFFLPTNPNSAQFFGHERRHHRDDHNDRNHFAAGFFQPAYIPYAVPYAVEDGDEANDDTPDADAEYVQAIGPRRPTPRNRRVQYGGAASRDDDSDAGADKAKQSAVEPEEPVVAQPSTVLVFKDGHKSDVVNYAIVGDTLFDLTDGRTRKILLADLNLSATYKANDERGVDFQVPASAKGQ